MLPVLLELLLESDDGMEVVEDEVELVGDVAEPENGEEVELDDESEEVVLDEETVVEPPVEEDVDVEVEDVESLVVVDEVGLDEELALLDEDVDELLNEPVELKLLEEDVEDVLDEPVELELLDEDVDEMPLDESVELAEEVEPVEEVVETAEDDTVLLEDEVAFGGKHTSWMI